MNVSPVLEINCHPFPAKTGTNCFHKLTVFPKNFSMLSLGCSAPLDQQQSPKTESGLRDSLWLASIETRQYRAGGNTLNLGGQL
jgi:hypothetical protein